MTTPAPAAAAADALTDLTPAINKVIAAGAPPQPPTDADMIIEVILRHGGDPADMEAIRAYATALAGQE